MWLIDAEALTLVSVPSYVGTSRPKYTILSHRWDDDEVTFKDFHDTSVRQRRQGFAKIVQCCKQTLRDGYKYTWVDTCCIDKTSNTELTESINSMYQWYRNAEVCYAFLSDVLPNESLRLGNSVWFSRGWTLQELVAPRKLVFYDNSWRALGDRVACKAAIMQRTHIAFELLEGSRGVETFSVAERMSWAGGRETTTPEDSAYCLLGIFNVSMAMLYGEGAERAFRRLQDEIIKQSDDHSIFAWSMTAEPDSYGLLARSSRPFVSTADVQSVSVRSGRHPYSVTNRGVSITLIMTPWYADTYLAILNCARASDLTGGQEMDRRIGIYLRRLYEDDSYVRVQFNGEDLVYDLYDKVFRPDRKERMTFRSLTVNIKQAALSASEKSFIQLKCNGFRFSEAMMGVGNKPMEQTTFAVRSRDTIWDAAERTLVKGYGPSEYSFFATLDLTLLKWKIKMIRIFLDFDFNPIIMLAEKSAVSEEIHVHNKNGQIIMGESAKHWTDKENEGFKPFHKRGINDEYGWNTISEDKGQMKAHRSMFREGLWMLRGDRVTGLDVLLEDLHERERFGARLTIKRERSSKGPIWDIKLEDVAVTVSLMKKMFR